MKRARVWIGIAISLLCLLLAFKDIQLAEIAKALSQANYGWLLPAVGLTILAQVGRAARWGMLFYPTRNLSFGKLFSFLSIGYLISNVMPARLGDFARAYLVSNSAQIPLARSLSATVVLDRAFDVLSLVVFLVVLIPFVPLPPVLAESGLLIGGALMVVLAGLFVLVWQRERSLRWLHRLLVRLRMLNVDRWMQRAESLLDGFSLLQAGWPLVRVILWSLGIWLVAAATYFVLMQAFPQPLPSLPFTAAVLVLCTLGLSVILPSSPGYIGVFHAATVLALSVFGVEKSLALSYAIVLHGLNYVTLTALGAVYALRESVSIWQLEAEVATMEGEG